MINLYALIYLVAYLVPAFVGAIALIIFTHLLSPAEYGIYVIGSSIAGIISAMFFTWVRLSVARYQASSPGFDLRPEATIAYAMTVLALVCVAPLALFVVRPGVGLSILAGSVFLALSFSAFDITVEFKRAQLNPLRFTAITVLRSLLSLLLGYAAIKLGGGGLGLLLALGTSFLIVNVLSFQSDAARPLREFSVTHLAQFARYGLPFSFGALTNALHMSLDRLGVAYLLGESAAGYYGLAADIPRQIINLVASSVASAVFPITFRSLAETGPAAARERLKEGAELVLALIAPAAIWLGLCADLIAGTLLGSEFQAGVVALLPLLAVGRMCGAFNQYYLQVSFQLAEKPLLQVAHDVSVLLANIALLLPLTLTFGLPGTAMAALLAEAFGILTGIWLSRWAFPLPFNGWGIARVFASTAVMSLATYAAKSATSGHGALTLLTAAAAGGLAYAGSGLLLDVAGVRSSIATLPWRSARWSRFSLWSS
jgi:O-antigen/teichoic acid export membrane protein